MLFDLLRRATASQSDTSGVYLSALRSVSLAMTTTINFARSAYVFS